MDLTILYYLSLGVLLLNWIQYLVCLSQKSRFEGRWLLPGTLTGFLLLTTYLILRWSGSGQLTFSTLFEALILLGWSILGIFLLLTRFHPVKAFGTFVIPTGLIFLISGLFQDSTLGMGRSPREFIFHLLIISACGAFTVSFVLALCYLKAEHQLRAKSVDHSFFLFPSLEALDRSLEKSIWLGVGFLGFGVILAAINQLSTGELTLYLLTDPVISGTIIMGIIYATIAILRARSLFTNRRIAYLTIFGFLFVVLLFAGINFYPEIHQY